MHRDPLVQPGRTDQAQVTHHPDLKVVSLQVQRPEATRVPSGRLVHLRSLAKRGTYRDPLVHPGRTDEGWVTLHHDPTEHSTTPATQGLGKQDHGPPDVSWCGMS